MNDNVNGRANSPAASDTSELTVLSRSPSPVPGYESFLISSSNNIFSFTPSDAAQLPGFSGLATRYATFVDQSESTAQDKPRSPDGRFISRRLRSAQSPSPDMSNERPKRLTITQQKACLWLTRSSESASPTSEPNSPMPWAVGEGGFGTLEKLPMEIRQAIYGYAFDIEQPVTVKYCCTPGKTKRKLNACPKHGRGTKPDSGRFNILQVSKAIREEAMWVVYGNGSLTLDTTHVIAPYVDGCRSTSMRGIQRDTARSAIWKTAAQFRTVKIGVPEGQLQQGDPGVFTVRLLSIATMLCKEHQDKADTVMKSVKVDLGSLFHEMLPFNIASQGPPRYGELLDWLCAHSPIADPDFDKLASEAAHNLQRLLFIVGKHAGHAEWKMAVKTQICEDDKGGAAALDSFQDACDMNGVVFERLDD